MKEEEILVNECFDSDINDAELEDNDEETDDNEDNYSGDDDSFYGEKPGADR
jgi:hypothetical protein